MSGLSSQIANPATPAMPNYNYVMPQGYLPVRYPVNPYGSPGMYYNVGATRNPYALVYTSPYGQQGSNPQGLADAKPSLAPANRQSMPAVPGQPMAYAPNPMRDQNGYPQNAAQLMNQNPMGGPYGYPQNAVQPMNQNPMGTIRLPSERCPTHEPESHGGPYGYPQNAAQPINQITWADVTKATHKKRDQTHEPTGNGQYLPAAHPTNLPGSGPLWAAAAGRFRQDDELPSWHSRLPRRPNNP